MREAERTDELPLEALEIVERAAQEEHLAGDPPPLREAGDRLVDDRLEDRGGDVLLAGALV